VQHTVVTIHKNIFVPACRNLRFLLYLFLRISLKEQRCFHIAFQWQFPLLVRSCVGENNAFKRCSSHTFDWSILCCSVRGTNTCMCALDLWWILTIPNYSLNAISVMF